MKIKCLPATRLLQAKDGNKYDEDDALANDDDDAENDDCCKPP